ncbi:MAG: DUF1893 domain-containing protein [Anaerolineae bacterium]
MSDTMMADLALARAELEAKGLGMVIAQAGEILWASAQPGVRSLLDAASGERSIRGAALADRVVGRAAALVASDAGLAAVYGVVMSEGALAQLASARIAASYGSLVPRILNKPQTDLCPLEKLTQGIEAPAEAVTALEAFTRRSSLTP